MGPRVSACKNKMRVATETQSVFVYTLRGKERGETWRKKNRSKKEKERETHTRTRTYPESGGQLFVLQKAEAEINGSIDIFHQFTSLYFNLKISFIIHTPMEMLFELVD